MKSTVQTGEQVSSNESTSKIIELSLIIPMSFLFFVDQSTNNEQTPANNVRIFDMRILEKN